VRLTPANYVTPCLSVAPGTGYLYLTIYCVLVALYVSSFCSC
jgi:hypothetical protein